MLVWLTNAKEEIKAGKKDKKYGMSVCNFE